MTLKPLTEVPDQLRHIRTTLKILVVDDSPYNLFVLKELISRLEPEAQVEQALNG
jgi:CheY-like chemotaxis protein